MKQRVPSLEQYAYGALPKEVGVPIQVIRSVEKKRSVHKPSKQQVQIKATRRHTNGPENSKIKISELVQQLRRNLAVYLETQPVVALNFLSNLYVLFQNNLLKTRILTQFSQSIDNVRLLNNYFYGDENICLLLKYSGRIYLVVLKCTYAKLLRHQTEYQQHETPFLPSRLLHHAVDNDMLIVTFAVAVKGPIPSVQLPVPFQQDSTLSLSSHLD